jgi:hypothetical protein
VADHWSLVHHRTNRAAGAPALPTQEAGMKQYAIFLLHLFNGTVATMAGGIVARKFVTGLWDIAFGVTSSINFELKSFFPFFLCLGILAGYVTYVRTGGKAAFWVWTVPLVLLVIRIVTFHSSSVFESGITGGINYFFGQVRCSARTLISLAKTADQCVNRMIYLGLICSALSYSAGAFLSHKILWPKLSMVIWRSGSSR